MSIAPVTSPSISSSDITLKIIPITENMEAPSTLSFSPPEPIEHGRPLSPRVVGVHRFGLGFARQHDVSSWYLVVSSRGVRDRAATGPSSNGHKSPPLSIMAGNHFAGRRRSTRFPIERLPRGA